MQQRMQVRLNLRSRSKTESFWPLSVRDTDLSKPEVFCSSFGLASSLSFWDALPGSAAVSLLGWEEERSGGL